MRRKPRLTEGIAGAYAGDAERVYDLTSPAGGGLVNLAHYDADPIHYDAPTLRVGLYRLDPGVKVQVSRGGWGAGGPDRDSERVLAVLRPLVRRYRDALERGDFSRATGDLSVEIAALAANLVALLDGTEAPR